MSNERIYLLAGQPDPGPHERDTRNGIIYRLLAVFPDRPPTIWDARPLFESAGHAEAWSWGNVGLKTATVFEAERIAAEVLGASYCGRVGDPQDRAVEMAAES